MSGDYRSRATPSTRGPAVSGRVGAKTRTTGQPGPFLGNSERLGRLETTAAQTATATGYLRERLEALTVALTTPCVARHEEPGELVSWANGRGITRQAMHAKAASTKAKRAMGERIARTFRAHLPLEHNGFVVVLLTRIAPRPLDSDNLEGACKGVRDGIAAGLGIDDRDPRVRYLTTQERGAPRQQSVRAELFLSDHQGETS